MKIYAPAHRISEAEQLSVGQIPLAYIDNDSSVGQVHVWKEKAAAKTNSSIRVWPLSSFDIPDPMLFKSDGTPASVTLQKQGLNYVYVPADAVEFKPLRFTADILVKKKLSYQTQRNYNLKVGASANTFNDVSALMPLFGDAAHRGLCPENISINNKDVQATSLLGMNVEDCDVLFIESADGININVEGVATPIDYDSLLDNNLIVWVFTDATPILETSGEGLYSLTNNVLFDAVDYTASDYKLTANKLEAARQFPNDKINNIFTGASPVAVIERSNKGFVVMSGKNFLTAANGRLFYEILMQLYLKNYYRTGSKQLWITDEPVDEVINNEVAFNRCHPIFNIDEQLVNDDCLIDNYDIVAIYTSSPYVYVDSIDRLNNIFFVKTETAPKDPLQPVNTKSIYNSNGSVLFYTDEALQTIETNIPVVGGYSNGRYFVDVGPGGSSSLGFCLMSKARLYLSQDRLYIIVVDNGMLKLLTSEEFAESQNGVKLAAAKITFNTAPAHLDIRIPGGGLPTYMEDDFNMMDISSYKGRPLRKGSASIIRLPKEMEQYDAYIKEAIEAHASMGSYIAVVYE